MFIKGAMPDSLLVIREPKIMKYVVLKDNKVKVFPESVSHSTMGTKKTIKSAGFIRIKNGKVETYDKSHSLNIPSRKSDAKLVEKNYGKSRKTK